MKLYAAIGILCVILGILGVFLPILPTTPFLLAAMWLFARSNPDLNRRLLDNRFLGSYVRCYVEKQGMPAKVKWRTISLLWGVILVSCFCFTEILWLRIILLVTAVSVTVHILLIKGVK